MFTTVKLEWVISKVFVDSAPTSKIARYDPLLRNIDLPLTGVYHPLGFRLEIATNCKEVLGAAAESWAEFSPRFECEPVRLRIAILPEGGHASEPSFRQQGPLFSIISDRDNFAICDLDSLAGSAFLSAATAEDGSWLRWYFLEALVYTALEQRYTVALHAACVAQGGMGVLLCGPSGAGKSTLAFACARAGWTYLGDESTYLLLGRDDRAAIGKPHRVRLRESAKQFFPELRQYAASTGPNGKSSIEVHLRDFPDIHTSPECQVGAVVLLRRIESCPARAERIPATEALQALLREKPFYGAEVWTHHERAVSRLAEVPAYQLEYDSLGQAIPVLCRLAQNAAG